MVINVRILLQRLVPSLRLTSYFLSRQQHQPYSNSSFPSGKFDKEEEPFIIRSPWSQIDIPEMNLADFVWRHVDEHPDDVALVCGITGQSYTYQTAHRMAVKFGSSLIRRGLKRGDVVGLVLPNIPEFPIVLLGAVGVGLTVTTIDPNLKTEEMGRQLNNSGTKLVITLRMFLSTVSQAVSNSETILSPTILIGKENKPDECDSFQEMVDSDDGSLYLGSIIDPLTEVALLPYSSGSHGAPKAVCLSHYNLVANILQITEANVTKMTKDTPGGGQIVSLAITPFFHIFGLTTILLMGLYHGVQVVSLPKFESDLYINTLLKFKPDLLNLVPPLLNFLTTNPRVKQLHLSSVSMVVGGSSRFGQTLINNFQTKFRGNIIFKKGFGLSEMSPVTHIQLGEVSVGGSCGFPVSNTLAKIVDLESGEALPPGEEGELCVCGPQMMMGYLNQKSSTMKIMNNGWLHTGDLARFTEDGQLVIVDRIKEMIKVKGYLVAPSEIEDLIRHHKDVVDVAVIGVQDEIAGEVPRAYVVTNSRVFKEESIVKMVAKSLEPHKRLLGGVRIVASLPKTSIGKVLRRSLKARVLESSYGY